MLFFEKMGKNIVIAVLILAVIAEGGLLGYFYKKSKMPTVVLGSAVSSNLTANQKNHNTPKLPPPPSAMKGTKLMSSPLSTHAYLVFPGDLTDEAKKATNGWQIKTEKNTDGSTDVSFIPMESTDTKQVYTVASGNQLYFVELNLGDDTKPGADINLRDDYGVITDKDGTIQ